MPQFDLAIRGGTIATAADVVRCDVGIADGRIASLARDITDAREVIDASELLVMPGGIDSHVHLAQLAYGAQMADDFESGSRSAVAGGKCRQIAGRDQELPQGSDRQSGTLPLS